MVCYYILKFGDNLIDNLNNPSLKILLVQHQSISRATKRVALIRFHPKKKMKRIRPDFVLVLANFSSQDGVSDLFLSESSLEQFSRKDDKHI